MYKILFDMRNDINDLKKLTLDLMQSGSVEKVKEENKKLIQKIYKEDISDADTENQVEVVRINEKYKESDDYDFNKE